VIEILGACFVLLVFIALRINHMTTNSDALVVAANAVTTAVKNAVANGVGSGTDPVDALLPPITSALTAAAATLASATNAASTSSGGVVSGGSSTFTS
jgi:uncharacterized membrane protein